MKINWKNVWILVLCFFSIGGLDLCLANEVYTPQEKSQFVEGGDAWESLNSNHIIVLDDNGFIIQEIEIKPGDDVQQLADELRADIAEGEQV